MDFLAEHGWWILIVIVCISALSWYTIYIRPDKFDPDKDICLDYECGYFNPFGQDAPSFRISQVRDIKDFINWTDKTKCPSTYGKYCYKDICTPNPLTIENCVEHRPKTFCEKCIDNWDYNEITRHYKTFRPVTITTKTCDSECDCDKYEEESIPNYNECIEMNCSEFMNPDFVNILYMNSGYCELCNGTTIKTCISAHPKPKLIPLDPEKEKCVVHTKEEFAIAPDGKQTACKHLKECCFGELDTEKGWDYTQCCDWRDKSCCIKKEPKTPCEMDNENYILDYGCKIIRGDGICVEKGNQRICRLKNECEKGNVEWIEEKICKKGDPMLVKLNGSNIIDYCDWYETICREKTLADLSCNDLWQKLEDCKGKLGATSCKVELLQHIIKKDC